MFFFFLLLCLNRYMKKIWVLRFSTHWLPIKIFTQILVTTVFSSLLQIYYLCSFLYSTIRCFFRQSITRKRGRKKQQRYKNWYEQLEYLKHRQFVNSFLWSWISNIDNFMVYIYKNKVCSSRILRIVLTFKLLTTIENTEKI